MHTWLKRHFVLLAGLALVLSACGGGQPEAQQQETQRQQSSYERLASSQSAQTMDYSPTRETVNFWIETWDEPGKLSYVYLQASNGQLIGYYVLEGLPVSMCAMLTPSYRFEDSHEDSTGQAHVVPAPSMDGVYYSGGQCMSYYGKDATTGQYIEFSIGNGINYLLFEEPMPRGDVEPLGFTTVEDVD